MDPISPYTGPHSYGHSVCIEGCVLLSADVLVYSASIMFVFCMQPRKRFGFTTSLMLWTPLFNYIFAACSRLFYAFSSKEACNAYFTSSGLKWVVYFFSIATAVVCNIFMLRNMSIASMLNSESPEQEARKRSVLKIVSALYLTVYVINYLAIYGTQYLVF